MESKVLVVLFLLGFLSNHVLGHSMNRGGGGGSFYRPMSNNRAGSSSMMSGGYGDSQPQMKPQMTQQPVAQKFEVHVYEVKPNGEMREEKPSSYGQMMEEQPSSYGTMMEQQQPSYGGMMEQQQQPSYGGMMEQQQPSYGTMMEEQPSSYGGMMQQQSSDSYGAMTQQSPAPSYGDMMQQMQQMISSYGEMTQQKSKPSPAPSYGTMMQQPVMMTYEAPAPAPMKKKEVHKTKKCFQCEYRPPRPETYEVLVREPFQVQTPKTVQECKWEKTVEYVYKKPKPYSGRMYGEYEMVPKWEKVCTPKTVYETETKYKNKYVTKKRMSKPGGFEACKGPIDAYTAKHSGVDDWDCYNNCFIKMDKKGTITRGCYSGQYKVDPNLLGCNLQGDNKQDMYCFCEGDRCNGQEVTAPKMTMPTMMSFGMNGMNGMNGMD